MNKIGNLMVNGGVVTVYHNKNDKSNPFYIYLESYYKDKKHEWPTKHKKLIVKYANLSSCTAHIHNFVLKNDMEG